MTPRSSCSAPRRFSRPISARRARAAGSPAPDPIFIVGLPRAGSTLLEQILASHPLVEGTMELPDIPQDCHGDRAARRIAVKSDLRRPSPRYRRTSCVPSANSICPRRAAQRKTDKPFFIDKMPNNCLYVVAHPSHPAEREDHRRPPASARLLLLRIQATFRPRPKFFVRSRRYRPVLSRLCRVDGACRRRVAGPRAPCLLRIHDRRHRS